MTPEQALDYIWSKRPDLEPFYGRNGWATATAENRRAIVRDWLRMAPATDPAIAAAGGARDPSAVARALGASGGAGAGGFDLDDLIAWVNANKAASIAIGIGLFVLLRR